MTRPGEVLACPRCPNTTRVAVAGTTASCHRNHSTTAMRPAQEVRPCPARS